MSYRIEIAKAGRAACKGGCKQKIQKGDIRFGTWVKIATDGSWAWRHWGCVTPKQIINIRTKLTPNAGTLDVTTLDGYDELSADLQGKVKEAIEQGHVTDSDWKGDPAENRLGASSKHKKAASKGKTGDSDSELESDAAAEEDDDDETAEALEPHIRNLEISAAAAGDDDADSSQENSKPTKRGRKPKNSPAAKKAPGRPKKTPVAAEEAESSSADVEKPAPRKRGRPAKTAAADDDVAPKAKKEKVEKVPTEPTRARSARNAGVKKSLREVGEDEDWEMVDAVKAPPKEKVAPKEKVVKEKVVKEKVVKEKAAPKEKVPKKPTKAELAKAAKEAAAAEPAGEKDVEMADKADEKMDKEMVDVIVGTEKPEEKSAEADTEEPVKSKGKGGRPKKAAAAPKEKEKEDPEKKTKAPAGRKRKAAAPADDVEKEEEPKEEAEKADEKPGEPKKKRGRPAKAAETKTAKAPAAAAKKGKATKKDAKSDSPKTTTSALEADLAAANQEDDAAADGQRKSIFGGDTDTEIAA